MMAEKVEQPIETQAPAKRAKAAVKKPAKKPKPQKQKDDIYLPVLAELTFTASVVFLIAVFLVITAVSWLTGASLLDFVLRTGIAMGVLGSLLMAISRQVSTGVLSVSQAEIEEKRQELQQDELEIHERAGAAQGQEQSQVGGDAEESEHSESVEVSLVGEAP